MLVMSANSASISYDQLQRVVQASEQVAHALVGASEPGIVLRVSAAFMGCYVHCHLRYLLLHPSGGSIELTNHVMDEVFTALKWIKKVLRRYRNEDWAAWLDEDTLPLLFT